MRRVEEPSDSEASSKPSLPTVSPSVPAEPEVREVDTARELREGYYERSKVGKSPNVGKQAEPQPKRKNYPLYSRASTMAEAVKAAHLKDSDDEEELGDPPWVVRVFGYGGLMFITVLLFMVFGGLLFFGMTIPCMELKLNANALVKPHGPIPRSLLPLIEESGVLKMIQAKVPIWHCFREMLHYVIMLEEGNCILAMVMLALAMAFPVLDMLAVTMAAMQLYIQGEDRTHYNSGAKRCMYVAKFLGKLSMLDVMSMGVVVVCLAAGMYRKMGVVFTLNPGIILMASAEVVHYIAYILVAGAVAHTQREHYSPCALCFCCG